MKIAAFLLPCTLLLAACGPLTTPAIPLPDVTVPLKSSLLLPPGKVIYAEQDALKGSSLPAAFSQLTLNGQAMYHSQGGTLSGLKVYVRPTLASLPNTCLYTPPSALTPGYAICDAGAEAAQLVSTLSVRAGVNTAFTLTGSALDSAARTGHAYFGVEVTGGVALDGETLQFTQLRISAKL